MLVDDIPLDDGYRSRYMMLIHKYIFEFFKNSKKSYLSRYC